MSVCFHRLAAPGQLVLFAMGGTAYLALEIAWRGTTHWTMFLAGGACLCALDALGRLPLPTPLLAGIGKKRIIPSTHRHKRNQSAVYFGHTSPARLPHSWL